LDLSTEYLKTLFQLSHSVFKLMDSFYEFLMTRFFILVLVQIFLLRVFEGLSSFLRQLCLLGVLEDPFLAVDCALDHAVRFSDLDWVEFLEFLESVGDVVVFEGGFCGDFPDIVAPLLDVSDAVQNPSSSR